MDDAGEVPSSTKSGDHYISMLYVPEVLRFDINDKETLLWVIAREFVFCSFWDFWDFWGFCKTGFPLMNMIFRHFFF